MRVLHTGDLHLGKKLNDYSLQDEQINVLNYIVEFSKTESVDAIIISGDIYDKSIPSIEATNIFDSFLNKIIDLGILVFIISGNHDGASRLGYLKNILKSHNIHVITSLKDERIIKYKGVNFNLIPFVKLSDINSYFNTNIDNFNEAYKMLIDEFSINKNEINVLVAHQTVLPSYGVLNTSLSEINIGSSEALSSFLFKDFSYVALGHIHKWQKLDENIYYPGSILKYHHEEYLDDKSFNLVDINESLNIERKIIKPLKDVKCIKGDFNTLSNNYSNDYVYLRIVEDVEIKNAFNRLLLNYPYLLGFEYVKSRISDNKINLDFKVDVNELFKDFYKSLNGLDITEEQEEIMRECLGVSV